MDILLGVVGILGFAAIGLVVIEHVRSDLLAAAVLVVCVIGILILFVEAAT